MRQWQDPEVWSVVEAFSDDLLVALENRLLALAGTDESQANSYRNILNRLREARAIVISASLNSEFTGKRNDEALVILESLQQLVYAAKEIIAGPGKPAPFLSAVDRLLAQIWIHGLAPVGTSLPPTDEAVQCKGLDNWIKARSGLAANEGNASNPVPAETEPQKKIVPTGPLTSSGTALKKLYSSFMAFPKFSGKEKEATNRRWSEIGEEVLQRKTLWLTAANILRQQGPPGIDPYKVAATDVFVEKAQKAITDRAVRYHRLGGFTATLTVVLMACACVYLWETSREFTSSFVDFQPNQTILMVLRMLTVGALLGGTLYFLISIARAFLHEGTALYSLRHALRFGRLYVYLKGGQIKDIDELEKAFRWNDSVHTAFVDIKPDKATKSFAQLVSEIGIEAIKATGTAAEAVAEKSKSRKGKLSA
ncbi:MAG: hypothetical protein WAU88_10890 [Candidatus Zixiibacteriota bacterium]